MSILPPCCPSIKRQALILLLSAWTALLGGCLPPQASFDLGVGTSRIVGFVNVSSEYRKGEGPIIVVYKYHHQFVSSGDGRSIVLPTAHVVEVDRAGAFSIDMPADVISMDILFIAPDRLSEQFRFNRQLGIGKVTYRAKLPPMKNWRDHYYTFLIPQLEHLIVETRYRLSPDEQRKLSDWLTTQNQRLEIHPKSPGKGS